MCDFLARQLEQFFPLTIVLVSIVLVLVMCLTRLRLHEAARRLAASERRFRTVADYSSDWVHWIAADGRVMYVSPASQQLTGHAPEEFERDPDLFCKLVHPDDRAAFTAHVHGEPTGHDPSAIVFRIVRPDGQVRWISHVCRQVFDDDGRPDGRRSSNRDITEQRRVEADLAAAKRLAERANRAKTEFLANMSHELRTPITAILGYTDLLIEANWGRRTQADLQIVHRNGEHLLQIINDILDISKIEANQMTVERLPCAPRQLVDDLRTLMQVRVAGKGLTLDTELREPLPAAVLTDPMRLRQILINLLGNAIKFTEIGGVRLEVSWQPGPPPQLQFDIVDTGIGMSPEQVARLFQPFTQADSSTARRFDGTGLGLSISRRLAEMLGGDVCIIETQVGVGTRIRATIAAPLADPAANTAASPLVQSPAPPAVVAGVPERLPCRILLAEDGPDNQRLLAMFLRKAEAEVVVVDNGEMAVEAACAAAAENRPFDVILMDIQMPRMDGYEATRMLRQRGHRGPIIALTAHALTAARDACLAAGCDDYTSKPITRRRLLEIVAKYLPQPAAPPASAPTAGG